MLGVQHSRHPPKRRVAFFFFFLNRILLEIENIQVKKLLLLQLRAVKPDSASLIVPDSTH